MNGSNAETLSLLAEPTRRRIYDYVIEQARPVGRDEAADALRLTRSLAAFHLDRLAGAGLLEVEYQRLGHRRGPGAGRPAKLYRRAAREVEVAAPPRSYRLAAEVFADALAAGGDDEVLDNAARHRGLQVGREARSRGLRSANGLMALLGYMPVREADGTLRARNCPFHLVAERQLEVTCGMNVAFLGGALDGAKVKGSARLEPRPEHCCVAVSTPPG